MRANESNMQVIGHHQRVDPRDSNETMALVSFVSWASGHHFVDSRPLDTNPVPSIGTREEETMGHVSHEQVSCDRRVQAKEREVSRLANSP